MKFILFSLFILVSIAGYSQQSSISITPFHPVLLLMEDKGAEKAFRIEFVANDLSNASSVYVVFEDEHLGVIVNETFTVQIVDGAYILSNGSAIIENKILIQMSLNEEQFKKINNCSVYITDTNGLKSNTLSIKN